MITEARLSPEMPENLTRLYDRTSDQFNTPLDQVGIADIDAIFELAIWTYPDRSNIRDVIMGSRNKHHIYWTQTWWEDFAEQFEEPERQIITEFRDGVPQKAYIPEDLHAWVEYIMKPPPPPPIGVMERRNASWEVASILLKHCVVVDNARKQYKDKKHTTRRVYGKLDGLTPKAGQKDFDTMDIPNREYYLSELDRRLNSWSALAGIIEAIPEDYRFVTNARLSDVRNLERKVSKKGAILPKGLIELEKKVA